MRIVAETIGVARPNLHEQLQRPPNPRGPYRKPEDVELLPLLSGRSSTSGPATAIAASRPF